MNIRQNQPFLPPIEEYQELLSQIWDSKWLTNSGPVERRLRRRLEERGLKSPVTTSSGHIAIEIALDLYDLKGEVITTPFTFASTTNAIVRRGLTPVFADIDCRSWNIDVEKIEELITEKTSAILAVHVFGHPCNIEKLQKIADSYGLKLIYDAAHSFGVKVNGEDISTYGDCSIFSLHATKLFHSVEGGVLCVADESEIVKASEIINFGLSDDAIKYAGCNGKMNELSAAMGVVNLNYLDQITERRGQLCKQYVTNLENVDGISFQKPSFEGEIKLNNAYMPILIDSRKTQSCRNEVVEKMAAKGIEIRKYFSPLTSTSKYLNKSPKNLAVAEDIASTVVSLPLHFYLQENEIDYVCDQLKTIL
jgi:dTDP-4-amino-4,6-dideoxygalactose transaminase